MCTCVFEGGVNLESAGVRDGGFGWIGLDRIESGGRGTRGVLLNWHSDRSIKFHAWTFWKFSNNTKARFSSDVHKGIQISVYPSLSKTMLLCLRS